MTIGTIKATKSGWLINGETELPLDYDTSTELGKAVIEWFKTNKAEPLYSKEEREELNNKIKFKRAIKAGKKSSDGVIWLNKDLALEFHAKLSTAIILEDKTMLWKDTEGEVIELSIDKAKEYLREVNTELNKAYFGREK